MIEMHLRNAWTENLKKMIEMPLKEKIIKAIEHNPDHYIELGIHGRTIKPCARCFGKYIGMVAVLPFALLFFLGYSSTTFYTAFFASWLLAIPAIADWSTVKLGIRNGNNRARVATGFLLGAGISVYFLIMPASMLFKLLTFFIYSAVFAIIKMHIVYDGFANFIRYARENVALSKKSLYSCSCGVETGCCCSLCNGCYGTCMNACLCSILALIAIPMLCCASKFICGGKKK